MTRRARGNEEAGDAPLALDAYETLAEAYAAHVDTKPHNAYCERPATLSLLPDPGGKTVLDAGCGPGVYAQWLVERGARVTAVDVSPRMLELARKRLGETVELQHADLGRPLDFLESGAFDIVVCPLVLDSIEDWSVPLAEFFRVLRAGGCLVMSVGHPFFDFTYFRSSDYFATERVSTQWRGFAPVRVTMPSVRRPLGAIVGSLLDAGFRLDALLEPKPTEQFQRVDPRRYEELSRQPCFLCVRACKDGDPTDEASPS